MNLVYLVFTVLNSLSTFSAEVTCKRALTIRGVLLDQHLQSHHSLTVRAVLCCLKVSRQPDEPDKRTMPTDHHSSSGVAEFRHEWRTCAEPHRLWSRGLISQMEIGVKKSLRSKLFIESSRARTIYALNNLYRLFLQ